MSLNLSNRQIAQELGLNKDDVQNMTQQLRESVCAKRPDVKIEGEAECDEVYVVAGHKGNTKAVKKKPVRAQKPSKRCTWQRHAGKRETAYFWYDSAWRSGSHSNA